MKILHPSATINGAPNLDAYFDRVRAAPHRVLLLDYDGTLAPFTLQRDQAFPYPGVRPLLESLLTAGGGRVVFVSGRAVSDLLPLLGLKAKPEIWGTHGWEHMTPDGRAQLASPIPPRAQAGLEQIHDWARLQDHRARIEIKPAGLALHWRGLDESQIDSIREAARAEWTPIAHRRGLEILDFDGGLEARVPGRSKGSVLESILNESDAADAIAYLGDDLTDEDAFKALGGRGLSVLARTEFRATAADLWITPPEELLQFLEAWLAACRS